jgi:hypothetical protein
MTLGDWVRIDDGSYRVGVIHGTGYGDEVTVITVPFGQVVSTKDVTPIPAQSGSPPIPFAGKLLRDNLGRRPKRPGPRR